MGDRTVIPFALVVPSSSTRRSFLRHRRYGIADGRRVAVLAVSIGLIAGISLVCLTPTTLESNSIGVAMILGAAIVYAAYVLLFVGRLARGVAPVELAAYVIAGKALSIGMGGVATDR